MPKTALFRFCLNSESEIQGRFGLSVQWQVKTTKLSFWKRVIYPRQLFCVEFPCPSSLLNVAFSGFPLSACSNDPLYLDQAEWLIESSLVLKSIELAIVICTYRREKRGSKNDSPNHLIQPSGSFKSSDLFSRPRG